MKARAPIEILRKKCLVALSELKVNNKKLYLSKLSDELKSIEDFDRSEYILNLAELIGSGKEKKRKNKNGLVYAFLLGITDSDPIVEDIPHVITLSDPPDIDVDLSEQAKEFVENRLLEKHGKENVLHIYTVGFYSPKSSIRMICRVMGLTKDMGIVKEITEQFGSEVGEGNDFEDQIRNFLSNGKSTLSKKSLDFLSSKPESYAMLPKEDYGKTNEYIMFKYASRLSGQVEKLGKHASGVAISSEKFTDFAPVKKVRGEYLLGLQEGGHGKEVSAFGCIKYDWLGLTNVTRQSEMFDLIRRMHPEHKDLFRQIVFEGNFNDPDVIDLFNRGETLGVFQFGSEGIRKCLSEAVIKSFNDIVIMNAMYRPGPLDQFGELVRRMRDPGKITYAHPELEPILKQTYGLIVYQEQVMQALQILGGFTLSEANKARALLKKLSRNKNPDIKSVEYYEYRQMLDKFKIGAKRINLSEEQIKEFVEVLASNMGYSFNKSHSVAYSINAYIDAYIKVHFPEVFYKVLCDHESDPLSLSIIFQDMKNRGIKINGFDLSTEYDFSINDNVLGVGFKIVKGVNKNQFDKFMTSVNRHCSNASLTSYEEFFSIMQRNNVSFPTIRTVEPMIELGVMDELFKNVPYHNRRRFRVAYDLYQTFLKKKELKTESKRWPLNVVDAVKDRDIDEYTDIEMLNNEFKHMGFYLFNDPISYARNILNSKGVKPVMISDHRNEGDIIVGVIADLKVKKTKNKKPYYEITFSDMQNTIVVRVWEDKINEKMKKGAIMIARLEYQKNFGSYTLKEARIFG